MLRERLQKVEERIHAACARAGRQREQITLVAVTKIFPVEVMREAYALGLRHFGENYVQEFEGKAPALSDLSEARFHLIGHLQSNKARVAAGLFHVIETIDSLKLANRLEQVLAEPKEVMIEVKLEAEETKHGVNPSDLGELIQAIQASPHLRLTGLMTIPPWNDDPEQTRPYFRRLAALGREHQLKHLSMGMSHDFEAAIDEGATHIRVGRGLFGERIRKA